LGLLRIYAIRDAAVAGLAMPDKVSKKKVVASVEPIVVDAVVVPSDESIITTSPVQDVTFEVETGVVLETVVDSNAAVV
jgi:hypothetical protein